MKFLRRWSGASSTCRGVLWARSRALIRRSKNKQVRDRRDGKGVTACLLFFHPEEVMGEGVCVCVKGKVSFGEWKR